ncbi:AMP-binding protein [Nonomuraea sp. NPDC049725]|uniref:AMP-binding protein n=1 Tax=Nonomuraea sp. NPDC049725 TaxID=3154508 RepID=UPI00342BF582
MADWTLYDFFRDTATKHGERVALEIGGTSFTYRRLLEAVERTAALIAGARSGGSPRIGLLASRSLAGYAGFLAILRLGLCAVPLNPYTTAGRNADIAKAAGLGLVVADGSAGHAPDALGTETLLLTDARILGRVPVMEAPAPETGELAYIGFTSGSSGRPKGVRITHANARAFVRDALERFAFDRDSRVAQVFELSFDPAIHEMFGAWGAGGTLCVVPRADVLFPRDFVTALRVTHLLALPSMISFALAEGQLTPGGMPTLRHVLLGGEAVTYAHAEAFARAAPDATLYNCYGPTELTVLCAGYRLPRPRSHWPVTSNGTVPIGEVYAHLEHVLLDEDGRPGEAGELCVRGPQRFPGYLDPAADAGRFVSIDAGRVREVTGTPAGSDWYRTGDRVVRENGLLVHAGRLDAQIKIDGFRVEPGEVEAVLRAHPGVVDVVVVPRPHAGGGLALVAHYTGEPLTAGELSEFAAVLPPHMRPVSYNHRTDIPLTPNGKADRRLLAETGERGGGSR